MCKKRPIDISEPIACALAACWYVQEDMRRHQLRHCMNDCCMFICPKGDMYILAGTLHGAGLRRVADAQCIAGIVYMCMSVVAETTQTIASGFVSENKWCIAIQPLIMPIGYVQSVILLLSRRHPTTVCISLAASFIEAILFFQHVHSDNSLTQADVPC